jgi:hypothetical protein
VAADVTVLLRHDPCPWLPPGGVAEVVAYDGPAAPEPTAVVRLLVTAGDAVLVVPRPDGRGPDLPTTTVGGTVEDALALLVERHLDGAALPRLVGFVRNTVPEPPPDYPWPAPVAHFAVWHAAVDRAAARQGSWLAPRDAARRLRERHWWPLLGAVRPPRTAGPTRRGVPRPGVASGHG